VIQLLSKKPVGILHLLDDESNFPRATDVSFLEKCHYNHALDNLYSRPRLNGPEFGVRHYAGPVWYNVDGFLDKNRDTLRPDVVQLLISSSLPVSVYTRVIGGGDLQSYVVTITIIIRRRSFPPFSFADVEQNVQLIAKQLRSVENVEQGQREVRHDETPDADGRGQVSRFVASAFGIHIGVSRTVREQTCVCVCVCMYVSRLIFIRVGCCGVFVVQMPSVVRALYQTELREGLDEVRHAHRPGTTPVLGHVGNDKDSQTGLSGAHEVQRVRGQVSCAGAETETAAERHAEQVYIYVIIRRPYTSLYDVGRREY